MKEAMEAVRLIATPHIGFIETETFTDAEKEQLELSYLTDHQDRAQTLCKNAKDCSVFRFGCKSS